VDDNQEPEVSSIGSFFQSLIDDAKSVGKKSLQIILTALGIFSICWLIFIIFIYFLLTGLGPEWYFKGLAIIIVMGLVLLPLFLAFEYSSAFFNLFKEKNADADSDPTATPATRINPLVKFFSFFSVIGTELKRLTVFIGENRLLKNSIIGVILLFLFFSTLPYFAGKWGGVRLDSDEYGLKTILDTNGLWPGKYEFYNPFGNGGKMTEKERAKMALKQYNAETERMREERKNSIWDRILYGDQSDDNTSETTAENSKKTAESDQSSSGSGFTSGTGDVPVLSPGEKFVTTDDKEPYVDIKNQFPEVSRTENLQVY